MYEGRQLVHMRVCVREKERERESCYRCVCVRERERELLQVCVCPDVSTPQEVSPSQMLHT